MEYEGRQKLHPSACQTQRLRIFQSLCDRLATGAAEEHKASRADLTIRLADGRTVKGSAGVTSPLQIAKSERVKGAVASRVNGALWDLSRPLVEDCELQLLGFDSLEGRQVVWRTGACVLASVMENLFSARVCREGVSDTGLYCDYQLQNNALSLLDVEQRCKQMAAGKIPVIKLEVTVQDLKEIFQVSVSSSF
ncbi:probable threonine--tRNA ligase 2, cytoplasmic isoform X2 [Sinocyclocheilus anshuiensis]|uniref:probable threonine--tRNA ligase 2, cytoplasmic isoform X2 n=1 Tax=Sinocyclocheilus anshuiensis TaxID=1608454 RepID=UPI0007B9EA10|nr:PREDICTED: probable threonine--tRNA ligase 2, cytoplasmic isoform X2 [Sinocyclocheilus anshuiensis]